MEPTEILQALLNASNSEHEDFLDSSADVVELLWELVGGPTVNKRAGMDPIRVSWWGANDEGGELFWDMILTLVDRGWSVELNGTLCKIVEAEHEFGDVGGVKIQPIDDFGAATGEPEWVGLYAIRTLHLL